MPSFSASTATAAVPLDRNLGRATFTVSNVATQPMRARLVVDPQPPTRASWLSLDGDAEREFATNESQQVAVKIAVPADSAAAVYPFRLKVLSVVNPDTDFTDGPVVSFEVKAATPGPPLPRWLLPAILAAVLLLVAGGVVTWLVWPRPIPDIAGLNAEGARARLEGAGLKVKLEEKVTDQEPGTVLGLEPPSGSSRPADGVVTLTAEASLVDVPILVGKKTSDAEAELTRRNLFYVPGGHELSTDPAKVNTVKSQQPLPGKSGDLYVRRGSTVLVDVFEEGVDLPTLVGRKWSDPATIALLTSKSLVPGVVTRGHVGGKPPGEVLTQNPTPAQSPKVAKGTQVNVTVQERSVIVPVLQGHPYSEVQAKLVENDLVLGTVTFVPPLNQPGKLWRQPSMVLTQVPGPGLPAKTGEPVTLTVSTVPILIIINQPGTSFMKKVDPAIIKALQSHK